MRYDDIVGGLGGVGIEGGDQGQPDERADDLGDDEARRGGRCDAREGVGEHSANGYGRVGERR